jgi:DNA-binding transcriptional LysR family regulator
LEWGVGAILFERTGGIQLTSAGEVLAGDLECARERIDDLRGIRRGDVSVWVIEGFVSGLLPDILANFHHRFPVCCKSQPTSGDRIIEALLQVEAAIGITFNASARAEMTSTVDEVAIACGSSMAA